MKTLFKLFIVFFAVCFISACEKTMFGVPVEHWNKLTKEQQQEVIRGYNQRKLIEKQKELKISSEDINKYQRPYLDHSHHYPYRPYEPAPMPFVPHHRF